jgi:hypothetical protein
MTIFQLAIFNSILIALAIIAIISIRYIMGDRTDPERSKATLEAQGFSDISTGKFNWKSCGDSDYYATEFTATNTIGKRVSGVVCCGYYKSCTIRF